MPMASSLPFHTAVMVRALIDGSRPAPQYETVYGELLVTPVPGPWHQELVGRLHEGLRDYVRREPVSQVFASPADISWRGSDVLVEPDVFVVPMSEARTAHGHRSRDAALAAGWRLGGSRPEPGRLLCAPLNAAGSEEATP